MTTPLNCHFVSRFLTKPWEWGDRQLHYYDFDDKRIHHRSSRSLFARLGENTEQTEKRLDRLIETPLSNALPRLLADPSAAVPLRIDDWELYRALVLLFPLQALRVVAPRGDDSLETTLALTDKGLDQLALAADQQYSINRVGSPAPYPLFYPETGFFSFPLFHEGLGFLFALAIPVTERVAFVSVPRSALTEEALARVRTGAYLSNSSVAGGDTARRVVIHPRVVERYSQHLIASQMEDARLRSSEILRRAEQVNALIDRGFAVAGLPPPPRR